MSQTSLTEKPTQRDTIRLALIIAFAMLAGTLIGIVWVDHLIDKADREVLAKEKYIDLQNLINLDRQIQKENTAWWNLANDCYAGSDRHCTLADEKARQIERINQEWRESTMQFIYTYT